LMVVAMASFLFVGCLPGVTPEPEPVVPVVTAPGAIIDIAAIPGVTAPVTGAIPDLTVTATAQYTGVTTWSPTVVGTFAAGTVYTATITLTPKTGFTLTGVAANFFTVAGATSDTNPINSGVVTAIFPAAATVKIIDQAIAVAAPVVGIAPATTVTATAQYTGVVTWSPVVAVGGTFAAGTVYTATITLTPKAGYTLTGVPANSLLVPGAASETNNINSGVVIAVFPATAIPPTVAWATTGDRDGAIALDETLILTFSIPMTPINITAANIDAVLLPSGVKTHLDSTGAIGSAIWNTTNTVLTITYSDVGGGGAATIAGLDTITAVGFTSAAPALEPLTTVNPYTVPLLGF